MRMVGGGGMEDFAGGSFVSGGGNLTGSDFGHSNLVFKTKKKKWKDKLKPYDGEPYLSKEKLKLNINNIWALM